MHGLLSCLHTELFRTTESKHPSRMGKTNVMAFPVSELVAFALSLRGPRNKLSPGGFIE